MTTETASRTCEARVDMRRPIRSERVRGFQPPWRTVYIYRCPECGSETRLRASSFRGRNPEPSVGAIVCGRILPAPLPSLARAPEAKLNGGAL